MEDKKEKKIQRPMRQIESKKDLRVTYMKRKGCIKKKTMELATLCGINACALCFGPDGEVETWPENPSNVKALIKMYKESSKNGGQVRKVSKSSSDSCLDAEKVQKVELRKNESSTKKRLLGWDDGWLDGLSEESLINFSGQLASKLEVLKARIEFLKMVSEQNRAVAVVGKETEDSSWFDDTTAIDNFEMDSLSMFLEPYYQPPQQTTGLNLEMDNLFVLLDPCYQPPQQTTHLNFEMDDLSVLLEPYYQPLQTSQEWFP